MSDLATVEKRVVAAVEDVSVATTEVQAALAELTESQRADKRIIGTRLTTALERLTAARTTLEAAQRDAASLRASDAPLK